MSVTVPSPTPPAACAIFTNRQALLVLHQLTRPLQRNVGLLCIEQVSFERRNEDILLLGYVPQMLLTLLFLH
jgi:hypothetical protein